MKRYVEIGSPCRAPYWSEKHFVVLPTFITHDSEYFNKIITQAIKSSQKPYLRRTANKKQWFNWSKTFWKSVIFAYLFIFSLSQISIISESKRPLSLINLPFTNAVWWGSIKERRNVLSLASNPFYITFSSRFNKEIGIQLQINLLSLFSFSNNLMMACFRMWHRVHKRLLNFIPEGITKLFCKTIVSRWLAVLKIFSRLKNFFFT